MKTFATLALLLSASWSFAAEPDKPKQANPGGENNQKDDGQKNQKDDGQHGQNGNAKVNELKGGAAPLGKPQLGGKKPAVVNPLAKPNQAGVLDNKAKPADGQNGQNDDGQQNQKDDGQKNNKDDGQQNNKDDGQQGQNGNNEQKGNKKK